MMSNIEEVKQNNPMPEVVRRYGIEINRAGFCRCPFHNEKTASMKIHPTSFFCYGCGAGGDLKTPVAMMLAPKMRGFINTKIHVQLPEGTVGLILDKSGLARKKGITILVLYPEIKRVAAIDSGERGMDGFGSTGR
jgi:hypothetical protein